MAAVMVWYPGCDGSDGHEAQKSCYYALLYIITHYYTYHNPWVCCTYQSHGSPSAAWSSSTWFYEILQGKEVVYVLPITFIWQEIRGPYRSATATAAGTVPIATTTTSPALTRAAGLGTAAQCTSWIPGRWAGPATPEVEWSAVCDLLFKFLIIKWCSLHFYDLSYNRLWLQETMPYVFHLYTLDFSTYSFLHPAWAAGFARGWCPLSTDTSWRNKVVYTTKHSFSQMLSPTLWCCSHLMAKVVYSSSVGCCSIPSSKVTKGF